MGAVMLLGLVVIGYLVVLGLPGWSRITLGVGLLALLPRLPERWWLGATLLLGLLALPQLLAGSLTVARWALARRRAERAHLADRRRRRLEPLPAPSAPAAGSEPVKESTSASPWVGS